MFFKAWAGCPEKNYVTLDKTNFRSDIIQKKKEIRTSRACVALKVILATVL